jgi:hypothetical protein
MKRYIIVVLLAVLIGLPQIARAQRPTPPSVPPEIEVPPGHGPFLAGHAVGTQGHVCVAVGAKFRWAAFGPHATLAVWGQPVASSADPNYVAVDAIPWLLLEAAVVGEGPTGGAALTVTRYIQRLNTIAGIAPSTGCAAVADIARRALVPYEADYFFFRERARDGRDERD